MTSKPPYHQWIESLVKAGYGNLQVLEETLMNGAKHVDATCTVLTLTKEECLVSARDAIDQDFTPQPKPDSYRAFIIEGLSSEVVEKVGSAFNIEPEFFASHLRATWWEYYDGRSNAMPFPSIRKQSNFWTLEYWECIQLDGRHCLGRARLSPDEPIFRRMFIRSPCGHIKKCTVALVNRFVSYWESGPTDGCSTRVILVDKPLPEKIKFEYDVPGNSQGTSAIWEPYAGGPLDFANLLTRKSFFETRRSLLKTEKSYETGESFLENDLKASRGCQESVKKALIRRLGSPELVLPIPGGGSITAKILQRIVLSHWALTLRFLRRDFDSVDLDILTNDDVDTPQTKRTLRNLGSCRSLLERCSVITRRNLGHLQIAPREDVHKTIQDATTTGDLLRLDWLFISDEIQHTIDETDQLINIRLASLSVLDSRQSHDDAMSSNQISKLGQLLILFFTPAAFAYGVLSMGGDFLPGNKKFWIFWAVAIPLSTITNVIFYLWKNQSSRSRGMRDSLRFLGDGRYNSNGV